MIPYITYREPNEHGELEFLILQKQFPNYVGRLVVYPVEGALANAPVTDHHLYISFYGCLMGNFIPANKGELENISLVFAHMSEWYYLNRISSDLSRYKKWKIISK